MPVPVGWKRARAGEGCSRCGAVRWRCWEGTVGVIAASATTAGKACTRCRARRPQHGHQCAPPQHHQSSQGERTPAGEGAGATARRGKMYRHLWEAHTTRRRTPRAPRWCLARGLMCPPGDAPCRPGRWRPARRAPQPVAGAPYCENPRPEHYDRGTGMTPGPDLQPPTHPWWDVVRGSEGTRLARCHVILPPPCTGSPPRQGALTNHAFRGTRARRPWGWRVRRSLQVEAGLWPGRRLALPSAGGS